MLSKVASMVSSAHIDRLRRSFSGEIKADEPMKLHTSFQIGGCADLLVVPEDVADLKAVIVFAKNEALPIIFIGNGTNLLVSDDGIRGIVVKLSNTLDHISFDNNHVTVGVGASLPAFIRKCATLGLSGLQYAAGIPGTVGGAIAMNAGAYGVSVGELVEEVKALSLSGEEVTLRGEEIGFSERTSRLLDGDLVAYEVVFVLEEGDPKDIEAQISEYMKVRREKQPLHLPSAGCAFKNPTGGGAGRYIDQAGLKGMRVGDAEVSPIHANFIVNTGNAKACDVIELMNIVSEKVKDEYGVELSPEVRIVGDF